MTALERAHAAVVRLSLKVPWLVPVPFLVALSLSIGAFDTDRQVFLPDMDDGRVSARMVADAGISLDEMDRTVARLEALFLNQPEVVTAFRWTAPLRDSRSCFSINRRWSRPSRR
jgi:multidrug efflux pump subunit AcrB